VVDHCVLHVQVGRLGAQPVQSAVTDLPGAVEQEWGDQGVGKGEGEAAGRQAPWQDRPPLWEGGQHLGNVWSDLEVAGERRHDVDVVAGHLIQAVEYYRVLPGQDRNG
jgi:hypothetical protein